MFNTVWRPSRGRHGRLIAWFACGAISACASPTRAPLEDAGTQLSAKATTRGEGAGRGGMCFPDGRSIADVAEKVTPSVVNVFSERHADEAQRVSPFFSDPFFRFFFDRHEHGPRVPSGRREQSLGSGVIVSSDGVILTNSHVVADADEIRVALKDGREFKAKVIGADRESDVAVLRIPEVSGLPALSLADSSKMRIGDLVLAIGNPFGLGQTVTMGIVSAVGRANMGITDYEDFIQTDAAINPGNSGGALVDMDGSLVGINTAIVSRSGGYQGIGFAIPSNMAVQVKDALVAHGKVVRGWLGVHIQDVTEEIAKAVHVEARAGVLVSDVAEGSPAAQAGLQRGDIITALDGARMQDSKRLRVAVALGGAGKKVRLDVLRDGAHKDLEITLTEAPTTLAHESSQTQTNSVFSGVRVQELSSELRQRFDIPRNVVGVLVTEVQQNNAAAELGLRPGDVIMQVNKTAVSSLREFEAAARSSEHQALVLIYREGSVRFLSLSH
ncbi:MAG: hypothetical protein RL701_3283 [Pseudomonadota bacterium]